MLPALRRQKEVSISAPAESIKRDPDEGAEYDVLESAAEDLCKAVHANDYKGVAVALRAAFELMETQPHEEAAIG
jgi:hypothetical protein